MRKILSGIVIVLVALWTECYLLSNARAATLVVATLALYITGAWLIYRGATEAPKN